MRGAHELGVQMYEGCKCMRADSGINSMTECLLGSINLVYDGAEYENIPKKLDPEYLIRPIQCFISSILGE